MTVFQQMTLKCVFFSLKKSGVLQHFSTAALGPEEGAPLAQGRGCPLGLA